MTRLEQQVADLRAENDELRETIAQLREALTPPVVYPSAWGLNRQESLILGALACRPVARRQALLLALYGDRRADDLPDPRVLDVYVCKLRAKLRPQGIAIDAIRGVGFRLDDATRARLAGGAS